MMFHERTPSSFLPLSQPEISILLALLDGPKHGYAIMAEINQTSCDIGPASLYRTIKSLASGKLVTEVELPLQEISRDQRRRYYAITPLGQKVIRAEHRRLEDFVLLLRAKIQLP